MQLIRREKGGRFRAATLLAMMITVLGATSACSSGAAANNDSVTSKNIDQWTMPLDEFSSYKPELGNYVKQLLIAKCLVAQGYEWPVPWQDTDFPQPGDFNQSGYRLFNMKIAQKWGYHFAPSPNMQVANAWARFQDFAKSYQPDSTFDAKFDACGNSADDKKTIRDADGLNYVSSLAVQATEAARQDSKVQEAIRVWQKCLSAKVSFQVPNDPWSEMPPLSVGKSFGLTGPDRTETASAEEISAAVADAGCRESSGVDKVRYDTEWEQQRALVERNRDKLDRIRRDAISHKKDLLHLAAENAPAAP